MNRMNCFPFACERIMTAVVAPGIKSRASRHETSVKANRIRIGLLVLTLCTTKVPVNLSWVKWLSQKKFTRRCKPRPLEGDES